MGGRALSRALVTLVAAIAAAGLPCVDPHAVTPG